MFSNSFLEFHAWNVDGVDDAISPMNMMPIISRDDGKAEFPFETDCDSSASDPDSGQVLTKFSLLECSPLPDAFSDFPISIMESHETQLESLKLSNGGQYDKYMISAQMKLRKELSLVPDDKKHRNQIFNFAQFAEEYNLHSLLPAESIEILNNKFSEYNMKCLSGLYDPLKIASDEIRDFESLSRKRSIEFLPSSESPSKVRKIDQEMENEFLRTVDEEGKDDNLMLSSYGSSSTKNGDDGKSGDRVTVKISQNASPNNVQGKTQQNRVQKSLPNGAQCAPSNGKGLYASSVSNGISQISEQGTSSPKASTSFEKESMNQPFQQTIAPLPLRNHANIPLSNVLSNQPVLPVPAKATSVACNTSVFQVMQVNPQSKNTQNCQDSQPSKSRLSTPVENSFLLNNLASMQGTMEQKSDKGQLQCKGFATMMTLYSSQTSPSSSLPNTSQVFHCPSNQSPSNQFPTFSSNKKQSNQTSSTDRNYLLSPKSSVLHLSPGNDGTKFTVISSCEKGKSVEEAQRINHEKNMISPRIDLIKNMSPSFSQMHKPKRIQVTFRPARKTNASYVDSANLPEYLLSAPYKYLMKICYGDNITRSIPEIFLMNQEGESLADKFHAILVKSLTGKVSEGYVQTFKIQMRTTTFETKSEFYITIPSLNYTSKTFLLKARYSRGDKVVWSATNE